MGAFARAAPGCCCFTPLKPHRNEASTALNSHFTLGRQIGDFLTYILLPMVCVFLPYRWGQALLLAVARRGWLLQSRSELSLQLALRYVAIEDGANWRRNWRLVEMMEARDLWLSVFGRAAAISRRIKLHNVPQPKTGLVLLGLHCGPTAIVLKIFQDEGLGPRFVYRGIGPELRRLVPFQWLFSKLNVRYIQQTCQGREILVPGARNKLQAALKEAGTPVILLDAPVTREGGSIYARVLGLNTEFAGEGPKLLCQERAHCVHYWLEVDENGERELFFGAISQPQTAEQLVTDFADLMSSRLAINSAHWRLWHAADQLFRANLADK